MLKMTARQAALGKLTAFKRLKNGADIAAGSNQVKVIFYTNDIFRIWMAPDGEFTDPAGGRHC